MSRLKLGTVVLTLLALLGLLAGCAGDLPDEATLEKGSVATAPPTVSSPPLQSSAASAGRTSLTGTLTVGSSKTAGTATIGTDGGKLTIGEDVEALGGMTVQVDPKAHAESVDYKVSYAPISANTYSNIRTVSPLITITNGGGYADRAVDVTVPVELEDSDFPLGFFYRGNGVTLEAMPLLKYDKTSVTVATCHFQPFFISVIKTGTLDAAIAGTQIDSGYRPGRDDWRFTNYGSFVAPNGHCAGMASSTVWYFLNKPDGRTVGLAQRMGAGAAQRPWEEESQGYRLASTVQKDINWDNKQTELLQEFSGTNDTLTMRAFGYAMLATGEPLEVGVFSNSGGGHSMVGYRIEKNALYVADPNYPGGDQRLIRFDSAAGKYQPYQSGQNTEEIEKGNTKAYEQIEYTGRTAFVDFDRIGARWKELQAGKVGNDVFPAYKLSGVDDDGKEFPLAGSQSLEQASLKISARLADGTEAQTKVMRDGKAVEPNSDGEIELKPGPNDLGIVVNGKVGDSFEYIDYVRVTVIRKT
jgi:hypothetical protein